MPRTEKSEIVALQERLDAADAALEAERLANQHLRGDNQRLRTDNLGLRRKNRQLRQSLSASQIDELTGVSNQNSWHKAKSKISRDPNLAIVLADLNNLKLINDEVSYDDGSGLLERAGEILQGIAETFGIPKRSVFRAGGDEFALAVPQQQADEIAMEIEQQFGQLPFEIKRKVCLARLCAGASAPGVEASDKLKSAQDAMQARKRAAKRRDRRAGRLVGR